MQYADITWQDAGAWAPLFDDTYASLEGAVGQAQHVFLGGNHLPERWRHREQFCIGELGFGTGLNFVTTWQAWERDSHAPTYLHYLACEAFPLHPLDLARHAAAFPELRHYYQDLRSNWPPLLRGSHRVHFAGGRLTLTLLYGDALAQLRKTHAQIDAWYLDGFAPRCNPELWSPELFTTIREHSHPTASFATYSVATAVQNNARAAGFHIEQAPGFGRKRCMLKGTLPHDATEPSMKRPQSVSVIGGGLAGCAAAYSFAQRGAAVTLYEAEPQLAMNASSQPAAILFPHLSKHWDERTEYSLHGYLWTVRVLRKLLAQGADITHDLCGMLWTPLRDVYQERLQNICERLELPDELVRPISATAASAIARLPLEHGGVYYPDSGWINLPDLCRALIADERIQVVHRAYEAAEDNSDCTIIANAHAARQLATCAQLPLQAVRGQITFTRSNPQLEQLPCILCYDGHITPQHQGQHIIGASYDRDSIDCSPNTAADHDNLSKLSRCIGTNALQLECTHAQATLRTSTPDRLPCVGQLDTTHYLTAGHGSRGLTSCLLAGEHLASQAHHEPWPIATNVAHVIRPQRFLG